MLRFAQGPPLRFAGALATLEFLGCVTGSLEKHPLQFVNDNGDVWT